MARSAVAASLMHWRAFTLGIVWRCRWSRRNSTFLCASWAPRTLPDYTPRFAGKVVSIRGVVSASAFHFSEYNVLAIEDQGYGAVLKVDAAETWLDRFRPGDEIDAVGTVGIQFGMPMLNPAKYSGGGDQDTARTARSHSPQCGGHEAPGPPDSRRRYRD